MVESTIQRCVAMLLVIVLAAVQAFEELPKFSQLKLMYPGYYLNGGSYRDKELEQLIGSNGTAILGKLHDTSATRMSITLNRYNGRHAIGTEPIFLSKRGRDSFTGPDGQEYIFINTAFGPYLAAKYGNPVVVKPNKRDHEMTMMPFQGKQGIVRLVSFHHKSPSGHMALWDCDHFYQSSDWTTEHHIISVEFWESPDSYCQEDPLTPPPEPHLQKVDLSSLEIIPRHNAHEFYRHEGPQPKSERNRYKIRRRHHKGEKTGYDISSSLWLQ